MSVKSTIRWNEQTHWKTQITKWHVHKIENLKIQINIQRNQTQKSINSFTQMKFQNRRSPQWQRAVHRVPGREETLGAGRVSHDGGTGGCTTSLSVCLSRFINCTVKMGTFTIVQWFLRRENTTFTQVFILADRKRHQDTRTNQNSEMIPDMGRNSTHPFTALVQTGNCALWERLPLTTRPAAPIFAPFLHHTYLPISCWHLVSCAFSFISSSCSDWTWRSLEIISLDSWAIWASQLDLRADASFRSLNQEGKRRECGRGSHPSSLLQHTHTHTHTHTHRVLRGNAADQGLFYTYQGTDFPA